MEPGAGLQTGFDAFMGVLVALGGILLKNLKDDITQQETARRALEERHFEFERKLPETYARRDDLKSQLEDIKATMRRIEDKIDGDHGFKRI